MAIIDEEYEKKRYQRDKEKRLKFGKDYYEKNMMNHKFYYKHIKRVAGWSNLKHGLINFDL